MSKQIGLQLNIGCLPGFGGVGSLTDVSKFATFMAHSSVALWDVGSPCKVTSGIVSLFALDELLVDVLQLADEGLVSDNSVKSAKSKFFDDGFARQNNNLILHEAYGNFVRENPSREYLQFCTDNNYWLECYSLCNALLDKYGSANNFPEQIKLGNIGAVASAKEELSDEMDYYTFCQYIVNKQWMNYKELLNSNGIELVGFVASDTAEVFGESWNQLQFAFTQNSKKAFSKRVCIADRVAQQLVERYLQLFDKVVVTEEIYNALPKQFDKSNLSVCCSIKSARRLQIHGAETFVSSETLDNNLCKLQHSTLELFDLSNVSEDKLVELLKNCKCQRVLLSFDFITKGKIIGYTTSGDYSQENANKLLSFTKDISIAE